MVAMLRLLAVQNGSKALCGLVETYTPDPKP